jgi:hypothetical protein
VHHYAVLTTVVYTSLSQGQVLSKPDKSHPRLYPYPLSFPKDGQEVNFAYVRALQEDAGCIAFRARAEGAEPQDIVIRFVSRYARDVHSFLTAKGFAPRLHYLGLLPNLATSAVLRPKDILPLMYMVVMDYIEH